MSTIANVVPLTHVVRAIQEPWLDIGSPHRPPRRARPPRRIGDHRLGDAERPGRRVTGLDGPGDRDDTNGRKLDDAPKRSERDPLAPHVDTRRHNALVPDGCASMALARRRHAHWLAFRSLAVTATSGASSTLLSAGARIFVSSIEMAAK
jgi:hypothetical protein